MQLFFCEIANWLYWQSALLLIVQFVLIDALITSEFLSGKKANSLSSITAILSSSYRSLSQFCLLVRF